MKVGIYYMEPILFQKNEIACGVIRDVYKRTPLAYVQTFGCQQNVNDGEIIKGVLAQMGFEMCDKVNEADFIIFNTCTVREHAELRVFGNIGALKALKEINPRLLIAVCGCMAQQKSVVDKLKKSYPYVDIVFGVNKIDKLPSLIANKLSLKKKQYAPLEEAPDIIEGMPVIRDSTFKAWLPVMYGCDNYCSYCIVPYVRGRERSRLASDILKEFKQLVEDGYKDITLLGQNVNSYGKGLLGKEKIDFSDLLCMLDEVPGDYRIRFMTSHPKDASRKLVDTIAKSKHICNHLHLPVQSGSDEILRQMNRRYTVDSYKSLIAYAKQTVPDMTFSSDLIVGFPGETPEDFEKTLELIEHVQFVQLFTFIYSKRTGTKAADMPDFTKREEKSARIQRILDLQEKIVPQITCHYIDTVHNVLVEGEGRDEGYLAGRLDNNLTVDFLGDDSLIGSFVDVKVTGARASILTGELVK